MRTGLRLLPLLACGLLLAAWTARAQNPEGQLAVGGEQLFEIRVPAGGFSIKQRVAAVNGRLVTILAAPVIKPSDVKIVPNGKDFNITVQNHLLVTVTQADGRVNYLTSRQQAEVWAKQLRKVLPQVNAKPNPNNQTGR
jgi:hypothetical protein